MNCGRVLCLYIAGLLTSQVHASSQMTTCAIRWDAWYTNGTTDPARYTASALKPTRFHALAPVHAKFVADGAIVWAPSQVSFDTEIRIAHKAGLCWAYVMYGRKHVVDLTDPMMKGLTFHRASRIRAQVHYAMIISSSLLDTVEASDNSTKAIVDLIADSNYQHVALYGTNKPLLLLLYESGDLERFFGGSSAFMRQSIEKIRRLSLDRHLGDPYIVILTSPEKQAEEVRVSLGADAISEYVSGERKGGVELWADFEMTIAADWAKYATGTGDAIPSLRSGADIRARCESPPPFEHRFPPGFDCSHFYVTNPTLAELQAEFRDAVKWVNSNIAKDPTRLILAYSWSECDESGNCLMPTIGDPQGRKLSAVASVLR